MILVQAAPLLHFDMFHFRFSWEAFEEGGFFSWLFQATT